MPIPYLQHELFEPNRQLSVGKRIIENIGEAVVIDNFFSFADDISEFLETSWVPSWKNNDKSKNYVDYYDCRIDIPQGPAEFSNQHDYQNIVKDLALSKLGYKCHSEIRPTSFNIFKWINPPESNSIQSYPHQDGTDMLAAVVYLDKKCDGGTAFYSTVDEVDYEEDEDIRFDVGKYAKLEDVVEANFNRCVIYPGHYFHGAYIDNHSSYTHDTWRKTMVMFFPTMRFYNDNTF